MQSVVVIAEAGVNHNGDMETAKKLVDAAAEAGADYVKFQTFKADRLVSKSAPKAEYQIANTDNKAESQYEMLKKLEFTEQLHTEIMDYCQKRQVKFLSTPFDRDSVGYLVRLGLDTIKIPSGEITNLRYLQAVGSHKLPVILSTGMATLAEVETAVKILVESGTPKEELCVLHCNTDYPTPYDAVNLRAMLTIRDELGVAVGYSDHTLGIEVPIAAVAMGATVIEKHFTLNRDMEGPDHRASLLPDELTQMVQSIRHIEKALGSHVKEPSYSERKNIAIARKSLVALKSIKQGERFTEANLTVKRPGSGITPMRWHEFLERSASRDFAADELITE